METWGVAFLGIIALMSLVQGAFLVGIAVFVLRVARALDALEARLDRQLGPALEHFERVSRNVAEVSDLATVQARRIDLVLADTIDKVEETVTVAQRLVARPLRPVANIVAVIRAVQKGLEVFLQLERKDRASGSPSRRQGDDDEHMFI